MMLEDIYSEEYYKSLNYSDYMERGPRYIKTAQEISDTLNRIGLLDKNSTILDFGCSVGFLLDGFKQSGYNKCAGIEVSSWARNIAAQKGHVVISSVDMLDKLSQIYDITIALDVFEHISDVDLTCILDKINTSVLVVRIPVKEYAENSFHLNVSKRDITHINCKSKEEWKLFFKEFGFNTVLNLNLFSIYDSIGVFCAIILK